MVPTMAQPDDVAADLLSFIDASPTPYHAVAEAVRRLVGAGFTAISPLDEWAELPAKGFLARDGALVAWVAPEGGGTVSPSDVRGTPFRIVGAHTDSPNLRIRPQPDTGRAGWRQLGVEVYGGALVNSWLDRDLGLSGRVAVRTDDRIELHLVRVDRPVLRIPQLAIHLDRAINEQGLLLDRQLHLTPVWSIGPPEPGGFARFLAEEMAIEADRVAAWDVMVHDVNPGTIAGRDGELLSAPRLDNLCSCHAAVTALGSRGPESSTIAVVALYDHEEIGSTSATGADGGFLAAVLERITLARGGDRADHLRALAGSSCVSADMAHATHPNYLERHEPDHPVIVNGGPVVKINVNQRYATDGRTQAGFEQACADAGVPFQRFVSRGNMPCGSTIGPITAARLGIPTVDVGVAQLGMHSVRELCGSADPAAFGAALSCWLK
jgi:aspartyl aminopeptidase